MTHEEIDASLRDNPLDWAMRWCEPGPLGCACLGCANNAAGLAAKGCTKAEWEAWKAWKLGGFARNADGSIGFDK